ncbi:MAG: hypothetical protein JSU65_12080 [Candidatus Zixiibacteriota bacterium]|nr:MAG: hypothetical protein JSU65_12080 [candidate division Zixibacteria bacterium]
MTARVIDISDRMIYLEIEDQLRFRSWYRLDSDQQQLEPNDRIDFEFLAGSPFPSILIDRILD